jgi:hypothetical protein
MPGLGLMAVCSLGPKCAAHPGSELGAQLRLSLWNLVRPSTSLCTSSTAASQSVPNCQALKYFGSAFLVPVAFPAELFLITPFELGQSEVRRYAGT